jgi:hypothetical protein
VEVSGLLEPLTSKGVWAVLRGRRVSDDSLLPDRLRSERRKEYVRYS